MHGTTQSHAFCVWASTLKSPSYGKQVRQVGTQEAPICDIVRAIVKEARLVADFPNFSNDLDELIDIAMSNRQVQCGWIFL